MIRLCQLEGQEVDQVNVASSTNHASLNQYQKLLIRPGIRYL